MAAKKQPRKKSAAKKPKKRAVPKTTAAPKRPKKTYAEHERRRKVGVEQANCTRGPRRPDLRVKLPKAIKGLSKREAFLAAYRLTGSVKRAAEAVPIERGMHYRWLKEPAYKQAFEDAEVEANQVLIDECTRRAHEGVLKPILYQGVLVGYEVVYSDSNLQFLIRARDPRFREKTSIEHSGPGGGPIEVSAKEKALAELLSPEQLEELRVKIQTNEEPVAHPNV